MTEQAVRLTKKEAQKLTDELTDLVEVWRKRNQGGQDDGRRTYIVFQVIEPFPDHDPGASDCARPSPPAPTPQRSPPRSTGSVPASRRVPTCGC